MKSIPRVTLLFAAVALLGQLLLRELPEKILADLNRHAAPRAIVACTIARPAANVRPAPTFAFASGGLSPEQIALAGRVVSLSTQNLRAAFAASVTAPSTSN